jgi:tetratricopeptide (TPR) repeat protein
MALPVPAGAPWLARIVWRGPASVVVERPGGEAHLLERGGVVSIVEGPVRVDVRLIHRFPLRRLPSLAAVVTSLAGLVLLTVPITGVLGLVPAQLSASNEAWCASFLGTALPPESLPLFRELMSPCNERAAGAASGDHELYQSDRVAEYLQRILKKDFDGDADGVLTKGDRQHGEKEQGEVYLPAGDAGPPTRMGGAPESAFRPQRTPGRPITVEAPKPEPKNVPLASPVGTPIPETPQTEEVEEPPVAVVDPETPDADSDRLEDRAEDREGWGVRDWYDQKQLDEDKLRIEMMTKLAERQLRIDPDDPNAISLLAFYQYLNEDYDSARRTYDRFIERYPESAMGYNNKALVYKRMGRYADEESLYRIALSMRDDDTTTLNNLAVNLAHQKRFEEALGIMEELGRRDPDEPYAHLHRAKIYAEMGEDERSLHYLELSLKAMAALGTMHSIEFRQDIRLDPSFDRLRKTSRFKALLWQYYGDDTPVPRD